MENVPWLLFFLSFFVLLGDQQRGGVSKAKGKGTGWNVKLGLFSFVPGGPWMISFLSFVFSLFFRSCASVPLSQPASRKFLSDLPRPLLLGAPLRCEFPKFRGHIFLSSGNSAAQFPASSWCSLSVYLLSERALLSWSVNPGSKRHLSKAMGRTAKCLESSWSLISVGEVPSSLWAVWVEMLREKWLQAYENEWVEVKGRWE